jgi:hypothetical protein
VLRSHRIVARERLARQSDPSSIGHDNRHLLASPE